MLKKQLLAGGSVFVLLIAGSLSALAEVPEARSQMPLAQEQTPEAQALPAQEVPQPGSQTPQQVPQSQPISSEELQQFANVIPELQEIDQAARQQVMQAIEQSGLSIDRFRELYQTQQVPGAEPSSSVTPEEQESFNQASSQIQSIEQETLSQQEQVIRNGGIEPDRFTQILVVVQQDSALQQQVQQLIQDN